MIRYSHVSLVITLDAGGPEEVSAHLGVDPSRIMEWISNERQDDGTFKEVKRRNLVLDSPKGIEADPTARLAALADLIEPFAVRLASLDLRFRRWIDIVFHVTPQHPHGVKGEFDWFRLPAPLMKRLASWDIEVSFERFWFDHPDWINPTKRG